MRDVLHASAVAWGQRAVLLRGASGSGKSALAAQLIDAHEAMLVGDDRLHLTVRGGTVRVSPHDNLVGLLELRGLGLITLPYCASARLVLAVELVAADDVPRLAPATYFTHQGQQVPQLVLCAYHKATALTIRHAVDRLGVHGFAPDGIYRR